MTDTTKPKWICGRCGPIHGKQVVLYPTFHTGNEDDPDDRCGWCGSRDELTQPRYFGLPIILPEDSARGHFIDLERAPSEPAEAATSDKSETRED